MRVKVQGNLDAYFVEEEVNHQSSITGYVFTIGTTIVSQMSHMQKIIALSTIEIEYATMTEANKEII